MADGGWTEREQRIAAVLAAQEGVEVSFRLRWKARDLIRSGALDADAGHDPASRSVEGREQKETA